MREPDVGNICEIEVPKCRLKPRLRARIPMPRPRQVHEIERLVRIRIRIRVRCTGAQRFSPAAKSVDGIAGAVAQAVRRLPSRVSRRLAAACR
jgi:hypothetical protein